jgi:hypothetical protein
MRGELRTKIIPNVEAQTIIPIVKKDPAKGVPSVATN